MSESIVTEIEVVDKSSHTVDKIASGFKNLGKQASSWLKVQRQTSKTLKAANKVRNESNKSLKKLIQNYKIARQVSSKNSDRLKKMRQEMKDLNKTRREADAIIKENSRNIIANIKVQFGLLKNVRRIIIAYWEMGRAAIWVQKQMLKFVRSGITRVLGVLGQRLVGISEGFGRIGRGGMAALGQAMKDLLRGGVQALANGLKSLAKQGVEEFGKLQTSFQKISNFMGGMTETEMTTFQKTFKDIAKNSVFSLEELSTAFESLASVGNLTGQDLEDVGKVMEKLATASGSDLTATGELLMKTMNAFGAEGSEAAQHFGEVLLKVANDSALDMKNLGDAMQLVSGSAKALDMNVDETAALLGFLSNQGMSASRAGTSLNQAMTKMIKPTAEAQDVMNKLGVDFFNSSGEMEDMTKIIGDLNVATADMSDEEKLKAITEIFGVRGSRAILAMMNNTDQLNESIIGVEGTLNNLDGQAEKMGQTVEGSMQKASNSVDLMKASFGEALAPAIMLALGSFTDFINNNEEFNALMQELGVILNDVLVGLIPIVLEILPTFVALLQTLLPIIQILGNVLGTVFQMFAKGTPLFNALMKIVSLLVDAFAMMAPTIILLVKVIADAILPIFAELLEIFVNAILPVLLEFFDMFLELIPEIMPFINALMVIIRALVPPIMLLVKVIMDQLFKVIHMLIPPITMLAQVLANNTDLFVALITIVIALLPILNLLIPIIWLISQAFMALMPVLDLLLKGFDKFIGFVIDGLVMILSAAKKVVDIFDKDLGKKIGNAITTLKEVGEQEFMIQSQMGDMPTNSGFTTTAPPNDNTGTAGGQTLNTQNIGDTNINISSTGDVDQDAEEVADIYIQAIAGKVVN